MAKTQIKNYVFKPGIGRDDNLYPNAYELLVDNKTFIQKEGTRYITDRIANAAQYTPTDATYTPATGDMTVTIGAHTFNVGDAIMIDTYGITFTCQLDGDASLHPYPRPIGVPNETGHDPYYNKPIIITATTDTTITVNVGVSSDTSQHTFSSAKTNAVKDVFFNYQNTSQEKCERDIGLIIDAYKYDIRYGGNSKTHKYVSYYWDNGVAQVDGNRGPELAAHAFIQRLITDYIFTNTTWTPQNLEGFTQTLSTSAGEAAASTRIDELSTVVINVIHNGTVSLPTFEETGVGTITIAGRHDIDELLIITDSTENQIIFNFADPALGGEVELITRGSQEDFPTYLQNSDAVTVISLDYNTSAHPATDELQIFVEKIENGKSVTTVRPYDFGTDAIERMRIAPPLSMLDADFEYGLQPTKWSAIAMMRGYPSVYEIPGTDAEVQSITTDASTGTNGVGASLITVTTLAPHGFEDGTPVTIKALENSISGAARAEGSFVIVSVPTDRTFTYYAKSKVGTSNGEVLSTNYTQLREAGFYTGAGIDNADFQVVSNGSAGTMTAQLQVPAGVNTIPYDGNSPEVGSPLTGVGIQTGAQVTNFIDNSSGGGEFLTLDIAENQQIGDTEITVTSASGIVQNLAVDRGDGQAVFVNNIVGNTLELSGQLTSDITSNTKTYTGLLPNTEPVDGIDATFDITRSGGTYSLDQIATPGSFYKIGDRLLIVGTILGGQSPANDLTIYVDGVNANGGVTSVTLSGTAISGTSSFTGQPASYQGGNGFGLVLDVTLSNNTYSVAIAASDASQDFIAYDQVRILGSTLGGDDTTHDAIVTITSVGASGEATGVSISGTAPNADVFYNGVTYTTASAGGTSATLDIRRVGTVYEAIIPLIAAGSGYSINDTLVVSGADLGGATPTNDATVTIDNVDGSGAITATSVAGVAVNEETVNTGIVTNILPTGATFDVDLAATVYTVTLATAGAEYAANQQLTIFGNQVGGETPTNDITITITGVDASGAITTFNAVGTGNNGTLSYTNLVVQDIVPQGVGAIFTLTRSSGTYSNITLDSGGNNYELGNTLTIPGTQLDGNASNDIVFFVTGVSGGAITSFNTTFTSANPGTNLALICTMTMSEISTALIPIGSTIDFSELATLEATFDTPHGIVPGNSFIITVTSDDGSNNHSLAAGAFLATNIPSTSTLRFNARAAGTISTSATDVIAGTFYTRPDSFFIHRPFDGGVQLGTGGPQHGAQAIRQSKKYIRYQSGKGIMYTTGALFAPSYDLKSITAEGTEVGDLITITTDDNDHGVQAGGVVRLLGIETSGYNSGTQSVTPPDYDYTVQEVVNERTFKVRAQRRLGDTTEYITASNVNDYPIVQVFDEVILNTNTSDVHDFLMNETAYDTYAWGDFNNSGSITADDKVALTNYLQGIPQDTTINNRVITTLDELKTRRNTGIVEDTVPVMKQEAVIGFGAQMSVVSWHGATVRSGIFDDQNGIFWEYDGTQISVVQRTGTLQVAGTCAVSRDSNTVTGTDTRFRDQLKAGDRVIIRGMTHVISHVVSQTEINVTPDFRGVNDISGAKMMLITDKKVKQSEFNLDKLDGTGPSGYDMDEAKMQMIGIQYTWYGAGFIDFMVRGADGNFVFAHRMRNSNVNTEAFMRSGNLPVRYEVTNEGPPGKLAAAMTDVQDTIVLEDSSFFPSSGTVYIDNEIISFTANNKTTNTLTGCTRGTTLTNFQAGAERTYSAGGAATHVDRTGVVLISNTITPLISHWGSAFLTDGGFDEDRGYIFSYSETGLEASTTKQTAFMIRLAPSVSNAIVGDLGERELLNRAQLLLQGLEITSDGADGSGTPITGGIVIEGILNPQNYPINPSDVGWTGLSSVAQGGQPSFAQVASGGSVKWTTGQAATTTTGTQIANLTATLDTGIYRSNRRSNYLWVNATDYRNTFGTTSLAPVSGLEIDSNTGNIDGGTTINGGFISASGDYGYFILSDRLDGNINQNQANDLTVTLDATLQNRNFAYLTQASYLASGIANGTTVTQSGGSVTFPANTTVNSIAQRSFAGTTYYEITFNNAFSGTLQPSTGTVEFEFSQPPYAQPGETVFSFIAVPGERSTADFSELKELTNTTLGGRGTFPNGPDVLAINVYKVSGAATNANLILKWGEAQA